MLRGCVVRESDGACNRFMVVDETDMVSSAYGSMLMWDTSANASTSRATSTDFGYGSANTILLAGGYDTGGNTIPGVITGNETIWPTVRMFRHAYPQPYGDLIDSALDTRWFVPSRDELYVLVSMTCCLAYSRPINSIYSRCQLLTPVWPYYWSSSQDSSSSDATGKAWTGNAAKHIAEMSSFDKTRGLDLRVRLCRTF